MLVFINDLYTASIICNACSLRPGLYIFFFHHVTGSGRGGGGFTSQGCAGTDAFGPCGQDGPRRVHGDLAGRRGQKRAGKAEGLLQFAGRLCCRGYQHCENYPR